MQSRALHRPPVKWFSQKTGEIIDGGSASTAKVGLVEMSLRINGYLNGTFARGKKFHIWDKYVFTRATESHKPRKLSHIEQAMTQFRKQSTQWRFEDIWYRGHRRIKITPLAVAQQLPTQFETTRRFIAYVCNAAKMNRQVSVDIFFVHRFWKTSGLPEEWIRIAWQRVKKIRGYRVKWKGRGRGRKCVVSLPYFFTRSSFPSERRLGKTVGRDAPDFPDSIRSSGAHSAPPDRDSTGSQQLESGNAGTPDTHSGDPPARKKPVSSGARNPLVKGRFDFAAAGRDAPSFEPAFRVGAHWICPDLLMKKALWLACVPMKKLHWENCRVRWRFAHARGVAYRALLAGHWETAILDAWRIAVERSHEDACDHDLRERPMKRDVDSGPIMREPSAAVMYAWQILAKDTRSREQRWAEIVATPVVPRAAAPRDAAVKPKARAVTPRNKIAPSQAPIKAPVVNLSAREISPRDPLKFTPGEKAAQKTLESYLANRGLALTDLLKMSRAGQAAFVAAAFQAQGDNKK